MGKDILKKMYKILFCVAILSGLTMAVPVKQLAKPLRLAEKTSSKYLNVYGQPLQLCSQKGMAMTGFTRTGKCVDQNDDKGSHHICIDLQSVNGESDHPENFCA